MTKRDNYPKPTAANETAERSVLATLAVNPDEYPEAARLLQPFMFTSCIAEAEKLFGLIEDGVKYSTSDLGRIFDWFNLSDRTNLKRNVYLVHTAWRQREEIKLADELEQLLQEGKAPDLALEEIDSRRDFIREWTPKKEENPLESWTRLADSMGKNASNKRKGIYTGYPEFDRITGGLCEPDQIILAGRPKMGKTCIALDMALNASRSVPVVFFSLEMGADQIKMRLIAKQGGVKYREQRRAQMEGERLQDSDFQKVMQAVQDLYELPFQIENVGSLEEIKRLYRLYAKQYGAKVFFFDYLQQIDPGYRKGESTVDAVGRVSSTLKRLAVENKCCNVILSQFNREVDKQPGARPKMSNLRDSGKIEQDADLILAAYRPEYYGIMEDQDGESLRGVCELMNLADRHGLGLDNLRLNWNGEYETYLPIAAGTQFPESEDNIITRPSRMNTDDDIPF